MKRLALYTILFISFCSFCRADGINENGSDKPVRTKRHELGVNIGFAGYMTKSFEHFVHDWSGRNNLHKSSDPLGRNYFVLNVEYNYHITDKLGIGLSGGIGIDGEDYEETLDDNVVYPDDYVREEGRFGSTMWYVMPEIRYTWWTDTDNLIRFYSAGGIGVGHIHNTIDPDLTKRRQLSKEKDNDWKAAWQISPLGVEFGEIGRFNVYVELGYGCQGIFKLGLKKRL